MQQAVEIKYDFDIIKSLVLFLNGQLSLQPGQLIITQHYISACYFKVMIIDHYHKFHNVPVSCPTMHHSEQKCAHFCSEWCIVRYETGAFGYL